MSLLPMVSLPKHPARVDLSQERLAPEGMRQCPSCRPLAGQLAVPRLERAHRPPWQPENRLRRKSRSTHERRQLPPRSHGRLSFRWSLELVPQLEEQPESEPLPRPPRCARERPHPRGGA